MLNFALALIPDRVAQEHTMEARAGVTVLADVAKRVIRHVEGPKLF